MFESVISANFDAVALLRYGLFDESVAHLKCAIAGISAAGACSPPLEVEVPLPKVSSVQVADENGNLCSSKAPVANQTSCFAIFTRGFIFEGVKSLANTAESSAICACVGLYNMALAMHLKGLSQGGEIHLRKAFGLYKRVYDLLPNFTQSPAESMSVMFLAAVLNMIACKSELHGHAAVEEWKNVYNDIFAWATQTTPYPAVCENPQDLSFFTTSIVMFQNQKFATAAAA